MGQGGDDKEGVGQEGVESNFASCSFILHITFEFRVRSLSSKLTHKSCLGSKNVLLNISENECKSKVYLWYVLVCIHPDRTHSCFN